MQLYTIIMRVGALVQQAFSSIVSQIVMYGGMIIANLVMAISSGVATVISTVNRLGTAIVNTFRQKVGEFRSIGKAILDGIRQGILNSWGSFVDWLVGIVEAIIESVTSTLGIQSPSKVFAGIGKQIMAGMAQGIENGISIPVTAMQTAVPRVIGAATSTSNVQNNYYYGARLLLQQGQENAILSTLMD